MRRLFLFALVASAICLSSCGKAGRLPTYSVNGKLLVNGRPAEHATVIFHPVGATGPEVVKPHGKVGPDGSFTLTTYDGNDGAPAGEYKVSVEWWLAGRPDEGPSNRLPAKYAQPETSGLSATVAAGSTELKPFAIKR
jgi:hypothetical protein